MIDVVRLTFQSRLHVALLFVSVHEHGASPDVVGAGETDVCLTPASPTHVVVVVVVVVIPVVDVNDLRVSATALDDTKRNYSAAC